MRWKGVSSLKLSRAEPPRYEEAFLRGLGEGKLPAPRDWHLFGRRGEEGDEYGLRGYTLLTPSLPEGSLAYKEVQRGLRTLARVVGLETPPSPALPGTVWDWLLDSVDTLLQTEGEAMMEVLEQALEGDEGAARVLKEALEGGGWDGEVMALFVQGHRLAEGKLSAREVPLPQNLEALLEALEEAPEGGETLPGVVVWEEDWPGWDLVREMVNESFQSWWNDEERFAHLVARNEEEAERAGRALRAALEIMAWLGELGGESLPRRNPLLVRGERKQEPPLLRLSWEDLLPPEAAPLPGAEGMVD
ncbi:MAG: hypothetical protein ABDH20_01445 [Thermus sp.]